MGQWTNSVLSITPKRKEESSTLPMTPEEIRKWKYKRKILFYTFLSSLGMFLSILVGAFIAKL